jgi:peptidyl-prolyl cis-trans isomerase B (cyclophilin B)
MYRQVRRSILLALLLSLTALAAHAQDERPVPPQPVPQVVPPPPSNAPPTPTPTPTPMPAPKKANVRPSEQPGKPPEPFDKATVAEMAAKCVRLETEAGVIDLEMLPESAPETVRHFLNLVASGALDTTTFSRVVPGFVIQGGDLATRSAPATLDIAARAHETIADEPNLVLHIRGIVSMARPDEPNAATTHFFILVAEGAHLNGTFAAFARVIKGMDVVDAINHAEVDGEKPLKPVRLNRATIGACPAERTPEKAPPVPPVD